MASSPYRGGYGVDDHEREPNAAERELIEERRAEEIALWKRHVLEPARAWRSLALMAAILAGIAAAGGGWPIMNIAGAAALLLGGISWRAFRRGLTKVRARRGRWGAPAEEWRTHETRIRARSVVYAASTSRKHTTWILFEIPGGDWAVVGSRWAPFEERARFPHANVVITWLEPANVLVSVEAQGAPLPRHGATWRVEPVAAEGPAEADEEGFRWEDDGDVLAGSAGPVRRVPEDQLPEWVHEAARGQ